MASCGKMFNSVCLGIAMAEHPAAFPDGLAQKVFTRQYLPEAFPLSDPRKVDIELGHLLTMASGMADSTGNPVSSAIISSRSSRCLCPFILVMQAAEDRFGGHA
jgi:CubicO group peptidase (beta-lactamase class C family)